LQLESRDRQTVYEQRHIERPLRLVTAVAKLARDAEAVEGVALGGLLVTRRRRAVEEINVVRPVFDAVPKHIDRAALGDFPLQARQEFAACRTILPQVKGVGGFALRLTQKGRELRKVDAVLTVVVP